MDSILIENTLHQFSKLLEKRFQKEIFTTEDSIRYTFFHCLVNYAKLLPSDIILEYPHPSIPNAKVDAYVPSQNERPELVFEFKFDRAIPSGRNTPKPQKAGKIFADIMRLSLFPSGTKVNRYLIYVTDEEMASYFQNESNRLDDFFNLRPQQTLRVNKAYTNKHCRTFAKSAGSNSISCEIKCLLSEQFETATWLRVYEINPLARGDSQNRSEKRKEWKSN